jgi:hypothetical protein
MRAYILLVLTILPTFVCAGPIITDPIKVGKLYEKVRTGPFYHKVGPVKFKIYDFFFGFKIDEEVKVLPSKIIPKRYWNKRVLLKIESFIYLVVIFIF